MRDDLFDEGEVVATKLDEEQGGQWVRVKVTGRSPLQYPVQVGMEEGRILFHQSDGTLSDPLELLRALMRDCALTKNGVRVYFR